jgi:hypothetical protein
MEHNKKKIGVPQESALDLRYSYFLQTHWQQSIQVHRVTFPAIDNTYLANNLWVYSKKYKTRLINLSFLCGRFKAKFLIVIFPSTTTNHYSLLKLVCHK